MVTSCCICHDLVPRERGSSIYCSQHCIEFENALKVLDNNINQFGSLACPPTQPCKATSFFSLKKLFFFIRQSTMQ